ncbi:Uncharacterised protein [Chlamydia trachomatis]|nr:Uncharacterised protein [Chlamydia trachomatis]
MLIPLVAVSALVFIRLNAEPTCPAIKLTFELAFVAMVELSVWIWVLMLVKSVLTLVVVSVDFPVNVSQRPPKNDVTPSTTPPIAPGIASSIA